MPETAKFSEPAARPEATGGWSRAEIDAAIAGLDRATKAFSERVDAMRTRGALPRSTATGPGAKREPAATRAAEGGGKADFEREMREAERRAREYLERAKERVDRLVRAMIESVEREAAEIRRDAEDGIRERWREVEVEAGRYLDEAKRVGAGMVAERQQRIGSLSGEIVESAETLTAAMEDAERIRRQFETFVRALAETAGRIAEAQPEEPGRPIEHLERRRPAADHAEAA